MQERRKASLWATFAIVLAAVFAACATGGPGRNPPLGSGPVDADGSMFGTDDGGQGFADGGEPADADDAATSSPSGDDASSSASCNDLVHGFRALLVQSPQKCMTSSDCASGECCFVGMSGSACVMQ